MSQLRRSDAAAVRIVHLSNLITCSVAADTLELFYNDPDGAKVRVPLTNTGIAWWTDKHVKFRNPGANNANLTAVFQGGFTNPSS